MYIMSMTNKRTRAHARERVYTHTETHEFNVSTGNVPNNFAQRSFYICVVKAKFLGLFIFAFEK